MESAKILIVEDNTTVAEDARECLEGLGYVVTAIAASGGEAVESAEKLNNRDRQIMLSRFVLKNKQNKKSK